MINTVVLIPHYNNLNKLFKTLGSIHHESGINVLVVDDGSEEQQVPILSELKVFLNKNVLLKIFRLDKNEGITHALNFGLDYILKKDLGVYIARLDCGDVCVKNRFKIQEEFLNNNKEIDIVGSWVRWLDPEGNQVFCKKPPTKHEKIRQQMSVRCALIHPSTMYRVSMVESLGNYPSEYEAAEDYAYFFNIANQVKTANIPDFLTDVEHNEAGISQSRRKEQSKSKLKVILNYSPMNFHFLYGVFFNLCLMVVGPETIIRVKSKIFKS